ncbi:MAG: RNA polymerase Rpb4 [Thermosphaera aggregans]|uniref:RNA polymerase Rpb4 n=1 Tax=Thermosphaera aggregans TaxID=54254 RepID=UPI003BFFA1C9
MSEIPLLEEKPLTNPEALNELKKVIDRLQAQGAPIPLLLTRTYDYLKRFSKIPYERVGEVKEFLRSKDLREESIIMIVNMCPKTVDELRPLLELEDKTLETSVAEEILNFMSQYCVEKTGK